jgi:hypothetical protein
VNVAMPQRRGGYVETNAMRAMSWLLSVDPRRFGPEWWAVETVRRIGR